MAVIPGSPAPRRRFGWVGQYGWLLGLLLAGVALYRSTPLMTGPLSQAHAAFEQACDTCHLADGAVSDRACLKCHGRIRAVDYPTSLHRKLRQQCNACHREHRSRHYPLRMADPFSFDHDRTGLPLKKHHPGVVCAACHPAGKPFYRVEKRCAGCHPKWDNTTFNHRKIARVSLLHHTDFACVGCHPGRQYESPPICVPCHDKVYRPGDPL